MSVPHNFKITKYDFNEQTLKKIRDEVHGWDQWPLVYVLSDERSGKKQAPVYVGETADVVYRLNTHLRHQFKRDLSVAHLITSCTFNKSATLDIESKLIQYMMADGKFSLLNSTLGSGNHHYYQKEALYAQIFKDIWNELRGQGLVQHSIEHLDNSDLFKYSPYKALSPDQRQGLLGIMHALVDDSINTLIIEGGAGTGKSVLAIFLFKLLQSDTSDFNFREFHDEQAELYSVLMRIREKYGDKPSMALVVPMSSFRSTLKKAFAHISGLKANMVIGPAELARNSYDLVLVDEAHRLRQRTNLGAYFGAFDSASKELGFNPKSCTEVDWVLKQARRAIFFYDSSQTIKPSDVGPAVFSDLKKQTTTQVQKLVSQFRVRGGSAYIEFVDHLLNMSLSSNTKYVSKNYEFQLFDNFSDFKARLLERETQFGLARMIAGFSWPWSSKKNPSASDIEIEGIQLTWNRTTKDWINADSSEQEVGCIHTTQGYDLNYAGVIFGRELSFDKKARQIFVKPEFYFDRNGQQNIDSPEQLKKYILNIYKTIMLRGIRGTFVYACDPDLRDYLADHIPMADPQTDVALDVEREALQPYVNSVPLYDLATMKVGDLDQEATNHPNWIPVSDGPPIDDRHFACKIIDDSMSRVIPKGAICLFRKHTEGNQDGKIVLIEHRNDDSDEGRSDFMIRELECMSLVQDGDAPSQHVRFLPRSSDPSFEPLVLSNRGIDHFRVLGLFIKVLR